MIYVAGPFFTAIERMYLAEMLSYIREQYPSEELFIPMEHFVEDGALLPNKVWAKKVFDMDVEALDRCDKVIALYLGHYSDTGTSWELGYAYAKGKKVKLYIPKELWKKDMSLMPLNGATIINQDNSYFNQK